MPMAHPAESRRKPRRDWNVSRSICFVSSLYFFVQNSDFRRHRSAVLSGTTMVNAQRKRGSLLPTVQFPARMHSPYPSAASLRGQKNVSVSAPNRLPVRIRIKNISCFFKKLFCRRGYCTSPKMKIQKSPGFHILRSDLPSKNYLFYPVCLLVLHYALYYTFLIRKKQAIALERGFFLCI